MEQKKWKKNKAGEKKNSVLVKIHAKKSKQKNCAE